MTHARMLISISKSPALTGGEDEPERPCQADLRARLEVARETGTRMTPTPFDRLIVAPTVEAADEAARLCARCPVAATCLADNAKAEEEWALRILERLAGRPRRRPGHITADPTKCAETAEDATEVTYRGHIKRGTATCEPCRAAHRDARNARNARPPEHGTLSGYRRHYLDGEEPCEPCRLANVENARKRRRHPTARRATDVAELVAAGHSVAEIADELGITPYVLRRWCRTHRLLHLLDRADDSAA